MEAVGGSALAIGSIGGVIYLTPDTQPPTTTTAAAARLGAPTRPNYESPSPSSPSSFFSSLGPPLGALVGAVFLLLAAVLLSSSSRRGGGGRALRFGLLDGGAAAAAAPAAAQGEGGEEDDAMRYRLLLPSTVVEGQ